MKRKPRRLKEIVEYRHLTPFRASPEDVAPEAMHEVIRRIEIMVSRPDCPLTAELSVDVCRLLESRHREWLRADRAERRECGAYVEGRNDAFRAISDQRMRDLISAIAS